MDIKWIQKDLNFLGYNSGDADGIQGAKTTNAIKLFQAQHALLIDGIAGANTQRELKNEVIEEQKRLGVIADGLAGYMTETTKAQQCNWSNIKHFKREEFTCKCGCGLNLEYYEVVKIADEIRDHFGKPAIVTSGTRCKNHNQKVGGVRNSRHLKGKAIDLYIEGVSSSELMKEILRHPGIRFTYKINNNCCHMDIL